MNIKAAGEHSLLARVELLCRDHQLAQNSRCFRDHFASNRSIEYLNYHYSLQQHLHAEGKWFTKRNSTSSLALSSSKTLYFTPNEHIQFKICYRIYVLHQNVRIHIHIKHGPAVFQWPTKRLISFSYGHDLSICYTSSQAVTVLRAHNWSLLLNHIIHYAPRNALVTIRKNVIVPQIINKKCDYFKGIFSFRNTN